MLKFKDGKFVIMQVSDAQDLHFVRHSMIRMLNLAYDKINPDLIVLTGDNILGNHLRDARFGSRKIIKDRDGEYEVMKLAIDKLVAPIDKRAIPFAMIYGNHDDMNEITKKEQSDIFRSYKGCTGLDNGEEILCDETYNLPIYTSDGSRIAFNLYMFDSAWRDHETGKSIEAVKPEAVAWYKKKSAQLTAQNGGKPVPSILFQHIPIKEEQELFTECDKDDIQATPGRDGKFYKLREGCTGAFLEYPAGCDGNGLLEAAIECGDIKAMVFGHDHPNSFSGKVRGIELMQTPCASFRCYGAQNRGVRIFIIDEKTGDFKTYCMDARDIFDSNLERRIRWFWDIDELTKTKYITLGTAAVSAAICGGIKIYKAVKK